MVWKLVKTMRRSWSFTLEYRIFGSVLNKTKRKEDVSNFIFSIRKSELSRQILDPISSIFSEVADTHFIESQSGKDIDSV